MSADLDPTQFETREEVMFFDTDCGGVVHNLAYLRFIETCRTRLAAQLGMKLRDMAATQLFAVVLRTEIDYCSPARLADEIVIRGWVERIGRVKFWCRFEIVRPEDGTLLATCRQALALVQLPAGRPQRLPAAWAGKWPHLARRSENDDGKPHIK